MKTIRRLIHREALLAVTFVTAGFLALFFFFDLVDELRWVGRSNATGTYELSHALMFVVLSLPSHLYELLPMTAALRTAIGDGTDPARIRKAALREGLLPLRLAGAQRIGAGETTIDEVLKAAPPPAG